MWIKLLIIFYSCNLFDFTDPSQNQRRPGCWRCSTRLWSLHESCFRWKHRIQKGWRKKHNWDGSCSRKLRCHAWSKGQGVRGCRVKNIQLCAPHNANYNVILKQFQWWTLYACIKIVLKNIPYKGRHFLIFIACVNKVVKLIFLNSVT